MKRRVENFFFTHPPASRFTRYLKLGVLLSAIVCSGYGGCDSGPTNRNANFNANWNANISNVNASWGEVPTRQEYENRKFEFKQMGQEKGWRIGSGEDDGWIWVQAFYALQADPDLNKLALMVEVDSGNVTLTGYVLNEQQRKKAVEIVTGLNGVKSVVDRLALLTPSPSPTAQPSPSPGTEGFDIDHEVKKLKDGSAVTEVPTAMELGETRNVVLVLSPDPAKAPDIAIERQENVNRQEVKRPKLKGSTKVETEPAKYSKYMEANLSGQGFEIKAVTPERQPITSNMETKWVWAVTATTDGDQYLHMTMNAIFEQDGNAAPEKTRSINTFSKMVTVSVSWGNFFSRHWQWIIGVLVLPALGGVLTFIKWAAPGLWERKKEQVKVVLGFSRKK